MVDIEVLKEIEKATLFTSKIERPDAVIQVIMTALESARMVQQLQTLNFTSTI